MKLTDAKFSAIVNAACRFNKNPEYTAKLFKADIESILIGLIPTSQPPERSAEDVLKEAFGEIRFNLNGTVTNGQIIWAMETFAAPYISECERLRKEMEEMKNRAIESVR